MKTRFLIPLAALATLWSCSSEEMGQGAGHVTFKVMVSSDLTMQSRGAEDLAAGAQVSISNPQGIIRQFDGIDKIPVDGLWLPSGSYSACATAGDSVPASWDARYFKGVQAFEVTPGEARNVEIACKIANVAMSVNFDKNLGLSDLALTAGNAAGQLEWKAGDERRGYFMLPSADTPLTYQIDGKDENGTPFSHSGAINNPKPATEYIIKVRRAATPSGTATKFIIEVDSRAIEVNDQMVISLPPEITGNDFDITQPFAGSVGEFKDCKISVKACAALKSATLIGEPITDIDLINNNTGSQILSDYQYDPDLDISLLSITIPSSLLNTFPEGKHSFKLSAIDQNDMKGECVLEIVASAAPIVALPVEETDVWATTATLKATLVQADAKNPGFGYRKAGEQAWKTAKGLIESGAVKAEIKGLQPGTRYEFRATADGYEGGPLSFTTEQALQLPNAGFEQWNTSATPFLVYAEGGEMFWDSGNHGSKLMNTNITTPDPETKHSGSYSAKLASQFVGIGGIIGKFAAGNLFIGKYLATVGTDGVLGWGRAFASRPLALKGYVKYRPSEIFKNGDCPDPDLAIGKMDKGIIYIAILDASTEDYEGTTFPVIIKTRAADRKLFDPQAANVIAYGVKVFDTATPGEEMIPFEIPLDYRSLTRKAVNIMLVASASKGGDYFTGGNSVMWLDDLELAY